MTIEIGSKLGPYEILAALSNGTAGETYKATDSRLNRTVTVRLLSSALSQNPEIRQRVERDSKVIASLKHPNISALVDFGTQDGIDYVVTESLEGEMLAERLKRGPMELEEALKVGIAIADALDKAHRHGMIHRGLNPSNVMLMPSGSKLLNFGLARLQESSPTPMATSMLSTRTAMALLAPVPASAAPYLAPEQLDGKEPDARTDLFSFGAILYEMICGKPAFEGKTQPLLIASITTVDPDPISKVQPLAPAALDHVLKRCLAKDPRQRLQTAWDLLCQLQWIAEGGSQVGISAPVTASRKKRDRLFWIAAAALLLLGAGMSPAAVRYLRGAPDQDSVRYTVNGMGSATATPVSISPDGRWIITSAGSPARGVSALLSDSVVPDILIKDSIVTQPFWSPNSHTIGFFEDGKLKKAETSGGPAQPICDAPPPIGGATWSRDDVILFASAGVLNRVLAAGGQPTPLMALDASKQETEHIAPYFLPDGNHFLFIVKSSDPKVSGLYVAALDSKDRTRLLDIDSKAIYVEPGYLLFNRAGTIFAQGFDAKKLVLQGEAIRVADGVPLVPRTGPNVSGSVGRLASFAASNTGVLIFRNSTGAGGQTTNADDHYLVWVDRFGQRTAQLGQAGAYAGVEIAPDGKRVAVHRHDADGGDSWYFDPASQNRMQRLTFDTSQHNVSPLWSPGDGKRIAYGSMRNGKWGIYIKLVDGTGKEELLLESDAPISPMSWSPDGKIIVYWIGSGDIWGVRLEGDRKPFPIATTSANELLPQVSPDGKWIAYQSNETANTSQIYIKSFPDGTAKWQASLDGGQWARWKGDSKELYFQQGGSIFAVDIKVTGASVQPGPPLPLFMLSSNPSLSAHATSYHRYAVSADGQHFLIPQVSTSNITSGGLADSLASAADQNGSPTGSANAITVVLNWPNMKKPGH